MNPKTVMNRHLLNGLATSFVVGVTGSALWLAHAIQQPERPLVRQIAQQSNSTSQAAQTASGNAPAAPQTLLLAPERR